MQDVVFLNGEYVPKEHAHISPDDRGFYFADGVYEVIKFYKGKAFCIGDHIERFRKSLDAVRIGNFNTAEFEEICNRLIQLNGMNDKYAAVYIQVTRGTSPRMHRFPVPEIIPTVYATAFNMPFSGYDAKNGISVITTEDIRWKRCDIKAISLLANILTFQEAVEAGAKECFYIRDGVFTECSHSNILAIKDGILYTHPDSRYILSGITKKVILKICKTLGINVLEEPIRSADTGLFDEFLICGTGSEILPVVAIDGIPVKDGMAGDYTRKLQKAFYEMTYSGLAGENIDIENL